MTTFLDQTQDYNPLTWDIQLNPAAWWLSLQDINSAASVELKSSLYSGNLNLTADQYREVQSLVADKYSAIDTSGIIAPGAITKNWEIAWGIDMTWKDPGLYMSNDRLWFYDGTAWQVWIGNNGDFFFGGDANNYIEWSGSVLTVKWDIEVADGSITAPKLAASLVYAWEIVIDTSGEIRSGQTAYDTGTWFWLWDVAWVKKFSIGNGTKWLKWDGSDLTIRWNLYAESGTFTWSISSTASLDIWSAWNIKGWQTAYNTGTGFWLWDDAWTKKFSIGNATNALTWNGSVLWIAWSITSTATITGGTLQTASSWSRIVITWSNMKSFLNTETYPRFQTWWIWVRFANWVNIADMYSDTYTGGLLNVLFEWRLKPNEILSTWNIQWGFIVGTSSVSWGTVSSSWDMTATWTLYANWKFRLPVWSNLY